MMKILEINESEKKVHELKQRVAALVDWAGMLSGYVTALTDEGFSREEAMTLAVEWQRATLHGVKSG